ncbi:MAG: hypothetical protein MHPSP_004105, partial [Paramarteilia canceri]
KSIVEKIVEKIKFQIAVDIGSHFDDERVNKIAKVAVENFEAFSKERQAWTKSLKVIENLIKSNSASILKSYEKKEKDLKKNIEDIVKNNFKNIEKHLEKIGLNEKNKSIGENLMNDLKK